jgi:hypothetical protein
MKVTVDGIGKLQDKYLNDLKDDNIYWLNESNLGKCLSEIFTGSEITHNKCIKGLNKLRPDYFIEDKNIVVEFHGPRHFKEIVCINNDFNKRNLCKSLDIHMIEIPYFIQLDYNMCDYYFKNYSTSYFDFNNGFPHGFIHPKCVLPYDFNKYGMDLFNNIIMNLSVSHNYIVESIFKSIRIRSSLLKLDSSYIDIF